MVNIITSGELALPLLQFLHVNKVKVSVFADNASQGDAQAQLSHFCSHADVPFTNGSPEDIYNWLKSSKGTMTFILGYGHLIDIERISKEQLLYCYNIHFGPLPSYRGANPVFWQIKNGSPELTVTIHRITKKFDDGPIFWKKNIKREPHFSFGLANSVLSSITIEGLAYMIQSIASKKILPALPAEDSTTSKYYLKPKLEDVFIDWRNMQTHEIANLILACNPWNKGAITILNGREVKILDAITSNNQTPNQQFAGTILSTGHTLDVQCIDNKILTVNMLNIDGTFVPARDVSFYGLKKGQCFTSNVTQQ